MTPDSFTGAIAFWDGDRGYGFIDRDDNEPDTFVHIRQVATEWDDVPVGTRVRFRMRDNQRTGRPQAYDVIIL